MRALKEQRVQRLFEEQPIEFVGWTSAVRVADREKTPQMVYSSEIPA